MLSVIIATRNRADALKNISLPSLLRQDCCDFEIIVWDASDGEDSREICASFAPDFKNRGIDLRYFRAPHVGLTSQRNDAVKEARGDCIFFIDDDSEVSPDGIGVLIKAFDDNPDRMGLALPLEDVRGILPASFYISILRKINRVFLPFKKFWHRKRPNRAVLPSAINTIYIIDKSGDAEWLSGCDMAFRKEIFENIMFDERLQKFGGYALAEDVDFSHRVILLYKIPLLVCDKGLVRHLNTGGGRIENDEKRRAAAFFNRYILRENFGAGKFENKFYFYWSFICSATYSLVALRFSELKPKFSGFQMARKSIS